MQCDYCDSKATVFFTQIIDGQTKKSSLCEKCATEHGVTDPEGFLIGHMHPLPKGNGGNKESKENQEKPALEINASGLLDPAQNPVCPGCGFAFDDLKKTGRLGCSQCYQFFREDIKHNLGGMHKGICHHGRVPEGMLEAFEKRQHLEKLQSAMEQAIEEENYEKAASLRDEIHHLSNPTSESTVPTPAP